MSRASQGSISLLSTDRVQLTHFAAGQAPDPLESGKPKSIAANRLDEKYKPCGSFPGLPGDFNCLTVLGVMVFIKTLIDSRDQPD
jgi:hypothetical protein